MAEAGKPIGGQKHAQDPGSDRHACDLLIRNGRILTLDADRRIVPVGAIAIAGHRIAGIGAESEIVRRFHARRVLDAAGAQVHPGFIDGHFHVNQHSARGFNRLLATRTNGRVNFADWKAALQDDDEYASSALACLDLLQHGYTGFVDGGTAFSPDAVADAARATGIRGWVADPYLWDRRELMDHVPSLISRSLEDRAPFDTDRALRRLGAELRRNSDPDALVRGYVALYGLGTASDELQRAAKDCANRHRVALIQHVGYTARMTSAEEAQQGRPAIVRLAELGILGDTSTLVHVNVVRNGEIRPLAESGSSVVWCPVGFLLHAAPEGVRSRVAELHGAGVNIGLGTDSAADCAVGDIGCLARHAAAQSGWDVSPDSLLEMMTIRAARSIAAQDEVGSLEVGKRADVVIRRSDAAEAQPGMDDAHHLAVLGRAASVDTVIVDGRIVLRKGHSTLVDEHVVFADVKASVERMLGRLGLR